MQLQNHCGAICLKDSAEERENVVVILFLLTKVTQPKYNYLLYKNYMLVMPNLLFSTMLDVMPLIPLFFVLFLLVFVKLYVLDEIFA
ncbi:hypothetical protein BRADI_2g10936v3 [Brachypodium distachyon]|uniref:Uncharacterized protein n=1 Tax=Brachypodium distachyon TaxID=15368 RepID=A0A0Q3IU65_BRADI|nr:hypothetical protein BRADI_2g10936v3 [Brachypodium distachyon]